MITVRKVLDRPFPCPRCGKRIDRVHVEEWSQTEVLLGTADRVVRDFEVRYWVACPCGFEEDVGLEQDDDGRDLFVLYAEIPNTPESLVGYVREVVEREIPLLRRAEIPEDFYRDLAQRVLKRVTDDGRTDADIHDDDVRLDLREVLKELINNASVRECSIGMG